MNALLKPVNAIKVLFLLLFLSSNFLVASCKKDDGDQIAPKTELQGKILGTWDVNSIDYAYYQNNVLDSALSETQVFESGDFLIEFKGQGAFIATIRGNQPQSYPLAESEDGNSFIYSDAYGDNKAVISLNGNTMTWVETLTGTQDGVQVKLITTITLTKK